MNVKQEDEDDDDEKLLTLALKLSPMYLLAFNSLPRNLQYVYFFTSLFLVVAVNAWFLSCSRTNITNQAIKAKLSTPTTIWPLKTIMLIIDSDTIVPEDCFRDAAREMGKSPDVVIIQHESGMTLRLFFLNDDIFG